MKLPSVGLQYIYATPLTYIVAPQQCSLISHPFTAAQLERMGAHLTHTRPISEMQKDELAVLYQVYRGKQNIMNKVRLSKVLSLSLSLSLSFSLSLSL